MNIDNSVDQIDQKIEELILMISDKGPKRWRQTKQEYYKKLENDNKQLKSLSIDLKQMISSLQGQNDILRDQVKYFQDCFKNYIEKIGKEDNSDK